MYVHNYEPGWGHLKWLFNHRGLQPFPKKLIIINMSRNYVFLCTQDQDELKLKSFAEYVHKILKLN